MKHPLLSGLLILVLAGAVWWFFGDHPGDDLGDGGTDPFALDGPTNGDPLSAGGGHEPDGPTDLRNGSGAGTRSPEDERAQASVTVRGRVVDDQRRPVSEAEVEVRLGERRRGGGVTDAEGAFAIAIGPLDGHRHPNGLVVARAPGPRVGLVPFWTRARLGHEIVVPTVRVRAVTTLRVRVVRDGQGVGGARLVAAQRTSGQPQSLAEAVTSADGTATVGGLPRGLVEVHAAAHGAGRGLARVTLPQAEGRTATIELDGERVVSVHVIDAVTRRPVAGAEVLVGDRASLPPPTGPGLLPPAHPPRTNPQGRSRIRGVGAQQTLLVSARAPGYLLAPWYADPALAVPPEKNEVQVALRRFRTVRFPVAPGSVGTPPDGCALRVELGPVGGRNAASGLSASMEDGVLVVRGLPQDVVRGVAVAANEAQASFLADREVEYGPDVTFRMSRTVVVRAVTPDGDAVPGVRLRLNPQEPCAHVDPALTDAEGRALFHGVGCDKVGVLTAPIDRPGAGLPLATLDLGQDLEVYEVEMPAMAEAVLRLLVDGEPRLPGSYTLTAGGGRVAPEEIEEHPDEGILHARIRVVDPESPLLLRLTAEGYLPAEANLPARSVGTTQEFSLELRPSAVLLVYVTPPPDRQYALSVQRFDEAAGTWGVARSGGVRPSGPRGALGGGDGTHRFEGLDAGRYRVVDAHTGLESDAADVQLDGRVPEIRFDLSAATWIEGRVRAPPGTNLRLAGVLVVGRDDPSNPWAGRHPGADGTFKIRAVQGRELTLTVRHPRLRPARVGGRVTVRSAGAPVVLRLERGPEVRFRVLGLGSAHTPDQGLWYGPVRVHLFRGAPVGAPLLAVQPAATGGVFAFSGYEPGTYTLWITFGAQHAPMTLPDVALEEGGTDLGTIVPHEGSTLRVRLVRSSGKPPPNAWMSVVRVGSPTYARNGSRKPDATEIVCTGLGPGRFAVTVRVSDPQGGRGGARVVFEQEVTLDGTAERVLDVRIP